MPYFLLRLSLSLPENDRHQFRAKMLLVHSPDATANVIYCGGGEISDDENETAALKAAIIGRIRIPMRQTQMSCLAS